MIHDWHNMLGKIGMLEFDSRIGAACRIFGALLMGAALLALLWLALQSKQNSTADQA